MKALKVLLLGLLCTGLVIAKPSKKVEIKKNTVKTEQTTKVVKKETEKTFAIIKPDAVKAKNTGNIIARIEKEGFTVVNMKKEQLTKEKAEGFYAVHKEKKFFNDLVKFMTSGPVVVMVLEKENAIKDWRSLMGPTNPEKAEKDNLRKLYGTDIQQNATHGSDSKDNAKIEIKYFFCIKLFKFLLQKKPGSQKPGFLKFFENLANFWNFS